MVAEQVEELKRACDRAGRDFSCMQRVMIATPMCGDPLESAKSCLQIAEQYAEIGMSELVIHWPRESGVYAGDEQALCDISTQVLPELASL